MMGDKNGEGGSGGGGPGPAGGARRCLAQAGARRRRSPIGDAVGRGWTGWRRMGFRRAGNEKDGGNVRVVVVVVGVMRGGARVAGFRRTGHEKDSGNRLIMVMSSDDN